MAQCVLTQVPDDLAHLVRVYADLDIGVLAHEGEPWCRPLHGLTELLMELLHPWQERQPVETWRIAAREALDILDDGAHPLGVAADDLRETAIICTQARRFAEELPGMAHGAYRVADLVSDARAQAAERRELRLLHLFFD